MKQLIRFQPTERRAGPSASADTCTLQCFAICLWYDSVTMLRLYVVHVVQVSAGAE